VPLLTCGLLHSGCQRSNVCNSVSSVQCDGNGFLVGELEKQLITYLRPAWGQQVDFTQSRRDRKEEMSRRSRERLSAKYAKKHENSSRKKIKLSTKNTKQIKWLLPDRHRGNRAETRRYPLGRPTFGVVHGHFKCGYDHRPGDIVSRPCWRRVGVA
jgi:hypothetical protein